jgi:hypothetical protein
MTKQSYYSQYDNLIATLEANNIPYTENEGSIKAEYNGKYFQFTTYCGEKDIDVVQTFYEANGVELNLGTVRNVGNAFELMENAL